MLRIMVDAICEAKNYLLDGGFTDQCQDANDAQTLVKIDRRNTLEHFDSSTDSS